jgi:chemotaxis protein histidine kinase CheA
MDPEMREFLDMFVTEGNEHLSKMESAAMALKSRADDAEAIETARVSSHTLKGMANQLGFGTIGALGKAVEALFTTIRKNSQTPSADMIVAFADSVALLKTLMAQTASGADPADPRLDALVKRLEGQAASCAQPQA